MIDNCTYSNEACDDPLQDQQSGNEDKYGGEIYEPVSSCQEQNGGDCSTSLTGMC